MIARPVRRCLLALVVAGFAASIATAASYNLMNLFAPGSLQIVCLERTKGFMTIAVDPALFGFYGNQYAIDSKFGEDKDVKGDLSIATVGLPDGLSVSIDKAKIVYTTEDGYLLKLTLKAEHGDKASVGAGDYHVLSTITNTKTQFTTTFELGVVHTEL